MQPRPTAAELLAIVAEVLDRDIVPALDGPVQHHARVAASLVAIVERELRLAPDAADAERAASLALLPGTSIDVDLAGARAALAGALRDGLGDDSARRGSGVGHVDEGGTRRPRHRQAGSRLVGR